MTKKRKQTPTTRTKAPGTSRVPQESSGFGPSVDAVYLRVHAIQAEARSRAWQAVNTAMVHAQERAENNFPVFSQPRTKLWQGLLTLPLCRQKVSDLDPGRRPAVQQTAGSGDPRRTAST